MGDGMGKNARNPLRGATPWATLVGTFAILVSPACEARSANAQISQPTWAQSCGYGRYYLGDYLAFGGPVDFTYAIDSDRGYVVDCDGGIDAYMEYVSASGTGGYTYAVWGQVGDNSIA